MNITLNIHGTEKSYPGGTPFLDIAREYREEYADDIVLACFQNHLLELDCRALRDGSLSFITTREKTGRDTYRRGVTLMMEAAARKMLPGLQIVIQHSLASGYYCEFREGKAVSTEVSDRISALKGRMNELAAQDIPIRKHNISTPEAIYYFEKKGRMDKANLLRYRRDSRINLYELDGYRDYYYGYMVPSTGYCRHFDLIPYKNGFVLQFPEHDTRTVEEFHPMDKLFQIMDDSAAWGEEMGVRTVSDLNDVIAGGNIRQLILVQESFMEQQIGDIAGRIAADPKKRIVLIAGPSSSGKTTFSHRLAIQLAAHGLRPHPISLDDFYVNREDTPVDENGELDFECLEAIDAALLNRCLTDLLNGREAALPTFNFRTGHREFRGRPLSMADGDVLVIEGIHGLNEKLTERLPRENKFKIYISALTHLNIDSQNNLSSTDGRILRRMVRDARTRDTTARQTIARWNSVRRGEERNIFPFREEADVMFNSALIYEPAVLKCYAEPLLFSIRSSCPEFEEAKRLLKILDYVLPVPGENIGHNSILREFIGGGCFGL